MASSLSSSLIEPPSVGGLELRRQLLKAQDSVPNEFQEKPQISGDNFTEFNSPISMRITVIGHPTCGKSTLLESLSILSYGRGMYSHLLNREIHSSDSLQENCAYTSLPFTANGPSLPFRYVQSTVDQYEAEAESWGQPRALTVHHRQPLLGVTCPGLSIVELSSSFECDRWAFVAPYLCVTECEIVIAVFDVASTVNPDDRLSRLIRSLLKAHKKVIFAINQPSNYTEAVNAATLQKVVAFFGQGLDIHNFDFKNDTVQAKRFEQHLRNQILEEMRFKYKLLYYRPSKAPLVPPDVKLIKDISNDFVYRFNSTVTSIVASLIANEEISRVKFSETDPVIVSEQLTVRLLTYAFSQLCNTLDRFILDQTGAILQKQGFTGKAPYLPGTAFQRLHEALYMWFLKAEAVKEQNLIVPGTAATVSGVVATAATFAMSFSGPAILAAAAGASIIGGATGYVLRPAGTVLKPPTKFSDQEAGTPSIAENELRELVWKDFQCKLADRSVHFEEIKKVAVEILKDVILAKDVMSHSLDDSMDAVALGINLDFSYLDSPSIAESQTSKTDN